MSFLTRMAEMLGAIATVKNGYLLFILPGGGVSANGRALPEFSITRSSGDRHSFPDCRSRRIHWRAGVLAGYGLREKEKGHC